MSPGLAAAVTDLEAGSGTLVVVPSMTFDGDELAKIPGFLHFEERMLWLLQVLRNPFAEVVYVTSTPLPQVLVEYSASLTGRTDAIDRITLVSCDDPSARALTHKLLDRPDVQASIRNCIGRRSAVLMCHVATPAEGDLATALGAGLFACPPTLSMLGTKSASRDLFRQAGVPLPRGRENLANREQLLDALEALVLDPPSPARAVVKLNESFAGGGNAIVNLDGCVGVDLRSQLAERLESARFVAAGETPDRYFQAFEEMGGVVEEMIDGRSITSPSAQCLISPTGEVRVVSTHEQVLGGPDRQTFYGCQFPAARGYGSTIAASAHRVAQALGDRGVIGHMSVDFVCREAPEGWDHFAIEVNLRMGGATAPIAFLELATNGRYDVAAGRFTTRGGNDVYYTSADRAQDDSWRALSAARVLDEARRLGLLFDEVRGTGLVLYMLGALPTVGKLGIVAIDRSAEEARSRFDEALAFLTDLAARD